MKDKKEYMRNYMRAWARRNRIPGSSWYETQKLARKEWGKRNPGKGTQYTLTARHRHQQFTRDYRASKGCQHCGERDPVVLEFHHLDPTKKDGPLSHSGWGIERIKREIEKCIVLCANCHRKEHKRLQLEKANGESF